MRITHTVTPASRAEWRRWLIKNHQTSAEIWILFHKKHTGKPSVGYADAVEEALCFGWIDGIIQRIDDETYGRRFTPRKAASRWSELNRRCARKMILDGKMTAVGLAHYEVGLKRPVDRSSGIPTEAEPLVPRYLSQALSRNRQAREQFEKLPPGYKRTALRWIEAAKREETRLRRVEEFVRLTGAGKRIGLK
jgi:uncharacterized protein YdeI (YjbR/CyaY-like superfamily)